MKYNITAQHHFVGMGFNKAIWVLYDMSVGNRTLDPIQTLWKTGLGALLLAWFTGLVIWAHLRMCNSRFKQ